MAGSAVKPTTQQSMDLHVRGLWLNPSQFSQIPPGATQQADDVVFDRENRADSRRGFPRYGISLGAVNTESLFSYVDDIIEHSSNNTLSYDSDRTGTWVQYSGTFATPSSMPGSRIAATQSNKNIYLTTNLGIYKTDNITTSPYQAGAPKGLGGTATVTGGSGFMSNSVNIAYRVVWGYQDANQNLILGPPSERIIAANNTGGAISTLGPIDGGIGYADATYTNVPLTGGSGAGAQATFIVSFGSVINVYLTNGGSGYFTTDVLGVNNASLGGTGSGFTQAIAAVVGGTANVSLTFQIPIGVTTNWFAQIYRSGESADLNSPPNDEMQQTIELNPTSGQIAAGSITVTDVTPNALLQVPLYTSPGQTPNGINDANWRPPFAECSCVYKNFTFYANTRTLQRLYQTLVATGSPFGIQVGDTITFTDQFNSHTFTLTGGSSENIAIGQFEVFVTGNPANDIQDTAQSIVRVINGYSSNDFLTDYYMSSFETLPGQMLFEKRVLNASTFTINSSRSTCWATAIPPSGSTTNTTSQDAVLPNQLAWSKFLQPEAVPLINNDNVGSASQPILRVKALRDAVIIMKADGVYILVGTDPSNWVITLLDETCRLIAPETCQVLDNRVYALTNLGVVAISDNDVEILSRPIETALLYNTSPTIFPNFADLAFGVAYNSDKKYVLGLPTVPSDTYCTQQYVWNHITQNWSRWTRPTTCGFVNTRDDKLYFGGPFITGFGAYVYQERKNFIPSDWADEQYNINITSSSGLIVNVTSSANIVVDQSLTQASSSGNSIVTSVVNGTQITVKDRIFWDAGAAVVSNPINTIAKTIQQDCGNPGIVKQISNVSFLFSEVGFNKLQVDFINDFDNTIYTQYIIPPQSDTWGNFPWGTVPWGGGSILQKRLKVDTPWQLMRSNWLIITISNKQCFTNFALSGISIMYKVMSARERTQ